MNAQLKESTGTELEVAQVTNALKQFDKVGEGLAALEKAYKGVVYPVREKKGMEDAKAARRAIKEPRVAVEKLRKEAKAPILTLGRKLDSEAERITNALEALEIPIDEQIKNEETRLHNEAVAKATAERERVERLEARLDSVRLMPYDANGLDSKAVRSILEEARALTVGDDWEEFKDRAATAKVATVASLEGVLAKAEAAEAEALRIIAERAELEKLRAAQLVRDAEARKAQEIENARVAAEQKAERDRLAAERKKLADEKEAEGYRIALENQKLDYERQAFAKEQERLDAERKERTRIGNCGFRAHFDRMTQEQADQLRALSDASPDIDVFALVMPKVESEIVLTPTIQESLTVQPVEAPKSIPRPTDDAIIDCIMHEFEASRAAVMSWLIEMRL